VIRVLYLALYLAYGAGVLKHPPGSRVCTKSHKRSKEHCIHDGSPVSFVIRAVYFTVHLAGDPGDPRASRSSISKKITQKTLHFTKRVMSSVMSHIMRKRVFSFVVRTVCDSSRTFRESFCQQCWRCRRRRRIWSILTFPQHVHIFCNKSPYYGDASISRLLQMIGFFCKRALLKRRYSAKEMYDFKEPTHRSHPILVIRALHLTIHLLKNTGLFCKRAL